MVVRVCDVQAAPLVGREAAGRPKRAEEAAVPADKARVVVRAPADARLWVDQVECPLPGTVWIEKSPVLPLLYPDGGLPPLP